MMMMMGSRKKTYNGPPATLLSAHTMSHSNASEGIFVLCLSARFWIENSIAGALVPVLY